MSTVDWDRIRLEFPILEREMRGWPLVYLDNAATSQKPRSVLDAMTRFYTKLNANVHRGVYSLSQEATDAYEGVRVTLAKFLGGVKTRELIFTRGTTEALNLVAASFGDQHVHSGDDIVVTRMEHHSNFVPWQQLAKRRGARFRIVELDSEGFLDLSSLKEALSGRPRILAFSAASNVLGTLNPIEEIAHLGRQAGATVVVDAAQWVGHLPLNMAACPSVDFLTFSSHKVLGPTGVGVLWGRESLLEKMPPIQFGGDMILQVGDDQTTWNELPYKFEAGTPNIAGVVGLGAAVQFINEIGIEAISERESGLVTLLLRELSLVEGTRILGPREAKRRGTAVSFLVDKIHPHDLATFLDTRGIAVRAGHHCAQPLMNKLGVVATTRASVSFYNTPDEVKLLASALQDAVRYFRRPSP